MPRQPRLQFPGAIHHIVTRGDARRKIFHDDGYYQRFTRGMAEEVDRSGWIVIAYCWMPNHIYARIKTPQPNLSRAMQHGLSGYANWYAKRNNRRGHLFQGRYKAFLVEDEVHGSGDTDFVCASGGVAPAGARPIPSATRKSVVPAGIPHPDIELATAWP